MKKITVIVPVYNTESYLARCVESIRNQSHRDLEVILVDDGSTDGSGELCERFAARDSRIRVIHQENRSLSAARNAGLDGATGQFVCFVDSDDQIHPRMLEMLLTALEALDAQMALCNIRCIPGGETEMEAGPLTREEFVDKLIQPQAWYYITATNKLYRRELFQNLRFPEGIFHEDEAVIYPLVARCSRVAVVAECLYDYLRREGSITCRGDWIGSTDKLFALSHRLPLCRRFGWKRALDANCLRFSHQFLEDYGRFPWTKENLPYICRMKESLVRALPYLWRSGAVSFRHKLYLTCIRVSPRLFFALRKGKRRFWK